MLAAIVRKLWKINLKIAIGCLVVWGDVLSTRGSFETPKEGHHQTHRDVQVLCDDPQPGQGHPAQDSLRECGRRRQRLQAILIDQPYIEQVWDRCWRSPGLKVQRRCCSTSSCWMRPSCSTRWSSSWGTINTGSPLATRSGMEAQQMCSQATAL